MLHVDDQNSSVHDVYHLLFGSVTWRNLVRRSRGGGHRNGLENLTHIAPVISAMRVDMQEHFFSCHFTGIAIRETKPNRLTKFAGRTVLDILHVPSIRFCHREMQLIEFRRFWGVGCRESMLMSAQMRPKNFIHHVDVIQRPDGCCDGFCLDIVWDGCQCIEQIMVWKGLMNPLRESSRDFSSKPSLL